VAEAAHVENYRASASEKARRASAVSVTRVWNSRLCLSLEAGVKRQIEIATQASINPVKVEIWIEELKDIKVLHVNSKMRWVDVTVFMRVVVRSIGVPICLWIFR
jgi:hypothetical protein